MPYIATEDRPRYEDTLNTLAATIREATGDATKRAGHMNYIFTRLLLDVYGRDLRYWQHNEIIGMLECCKQEFYRRQTAHYEESCIAKNGDV